ncbi:MAG: folylpolyglutamate synthase/dihydrofolate synthase family protein [Solirubrobacterales bacterium]
MKAERYLLSLELFGVRFGLSRMQRLMTALGSPQSRFESIHVLGTNGKSSTARMIAAILREHGVRTGAYLSPHITSFAERIEIDGESVSQQRFGAAIDRTARAAGVVERTLDPEDRVTQFEALTAAAYFELARSQVTVGVIEAGLGGRYDATSVICSRVQVLTNVGLEHTRWLGPTETHIAQEKLAVVPPQGTIVAGPLEGEALDVAEHVAGERGASLLLAGRDFHLRDRGSRMRVETPLAEYDEISLRPLGAFQRENFALAVAAAECLHGALDRKAVREAAATLELAGRLEQVGSEPVLLLDGAHNPSGMRALAGSLRSAAGDRKPVAVVSILDDKDAAAMLAALQPHCTSVVFTRSSHERALSPATLESLWRQVGGSQATIEPDPTSALRAATELAGAEGAVIVTGSIYLLSDLAPSAHEPVMRIAEKH